MSITSLGRNKGGSNLINALVSTFLLASAFGWYLSAYSFLQNASRINFTEESTILIVGLNFLAFILAALLAAKLVDLLNKRKTYIKYWLIIGVFISFLFSIFPLSNFPSLLLLSGIIGIYFGLGMPILLGYFSASTVPQNRGKFGGTAALLTILSAAIFRLIIGWLSEVYFISIILSIWLAISLLSLIYFKPAEKKADSNTRVSFRSVITNKTFLLYLIPWLMFSLVNDLTFNITADYFNSLNITNAVLITTIIGGITAILWGYLADAKGRKRLALIGFALFGTSYGAIGLFQGNYIAAWFYICVDGLAWGIFLTLFLMTLWGDIASERNSEKYYIFGVFPYLFSTFVRVSIGNIFSHEIIPVGTLFSFASFFLFIAILPLFYANETLSEKYIKDRELKSYIDKANKIAVKKKQETD